MENNPTLMTDPGIYLGKAEAVALAHLICAVNGRQLSACFCYTCSCLHKFLRLFFLMNKAVYSFTWQSRSVTIPLITHTFQMGFFPGSGSEEFAQVEKKKATQYNTKQIKACMHTARREKTHTSGMQCVGVE